MGDLNLMTFAISTAILFAFSAICNTKVSRLMDQITANLIRLLIGVDWTLVGFELDWIGFLLDLDC